MLLFRLNTLTFVRRMAAAFSLMMASQLPAQNLVTNGGFETGLTGWSNSATGGAIGSFATETVQPYAGAKAMKVVVNTAGPNPWNVQTLGPTFTALGTGRSTLITFRARATTQGTRVRFVMQTNVFQQRDFTLSTAWTYFAWNHVTGEDSPRLRIQYPDPGTVWLDEISLVAFDEPASGVLPVTLNPGDRRQMMDGIGGALTWYSTRVLSSPHKDQLEGLIFDDLGLDIIRLKNWYFPADYPNNKSPATIPNNQRTSYNANKTFYDMAKEGGRDISVLFSSWTPPENLKTNDSLTGTDSSGALNATLKKVNGQFVYADLAQYWVDLLDNMNWTPDYLSVQNEPGYLASWESCRFAPNQTSTLPGFAQALDAIHNRIKDRPGLPVLIGPESENMNDFRTQAAPLGSRPYIDLYAFHNYNIGSDAAINGEIPKLNQIRDDFDDRPNWMTEFSKDEFDWLQTARVIHNTLVEANASAYIFWKLVWSDSVTTTPGIMINIDGAGNYTVGPTYYAIKHYARHISRGHQRFEVAGGDTNVRASGYINPAGNQLTLVVINAGGASAGISLRTGGLPVASATAFRTRQFDLASAPYQSLGAVNPANVQTLAARSITTFVIDLAETLNPYDPALLRIDRFQHHGNRVTMTIPAQPGHNFILWKSPTLATGSWQKVTNAVFTESNGLLTLSDPTPGTARAYYRVQRDSGP